MSFKNVISLKNSLLIGFLYLAMSATAMAVPPASGAVFDDFEDGDTSDWGFFGGSSAGGGGGALNDRPKEGNWYFSTGWGGQGSASGFYGGAFKNLPDTEQVVMPADPWFNVWVLNQSDATVDSYTLEITIREDLDGNGVPELALLTVRDLDGERRIVRGNRFSTANDPRRRRQQVAAGGSSGVPAQAHSPSRDRHQCSGFGPAAENCWWRTT